jgi:hypothetical protein
MVLDYSSRENMWLLFTERALALKKILNQETNDKRNSVVHMEEKTIQSIPVMPFALMYACISAAIGFIIGILYALIFGAIFASVPASTTTPLDFGWLGLFVGVGSVIITPIISFIGGLIFAAITALVYNFLAPRIGGVKVRFKEEPSPTPQS